MNIEKAYREHLPEAKLIGKRFTNDDRDGQNTFAGKWGTCHREDWIGQLKPCKAAPGVGMDMLGAMRMAGTNGEFEYWIGTLFAADSVVPDGFESAMMPAGDVGVCWLKGNPENGELYSMEASDMAMAAMAAEGMNPREDGWFFERYNMARFMTRDAAGEVILDICAYLT